MRVVISTGLLLTMDHLQSIRALNEIIRAKGFDGLGMNDWQAIMPQILQADDAFKQGEIDAANFQEKVESIVSQKVGQEIKLMPEDFRAMWNKMIKPEAASGFKNKLQSIIEAGHTPILISGTNEIHFSYLQSVLDAPLVLRQPVEETLKEGDCPVYATYVYKKDKRGLYDEILKNYGNDEMLFVLSSTDHLMISEVKAREERINAELMTYAMNKHILTIQVDPTDDITEQIQEQLQSLMYQQLSNEGPAVNNRQVM